MEREKVIEREGVRMGGWWRRSARGCRGRSLEALAYRGEPPEERGRMDKSEERE